MKILYISGMGRSGSTLLAGILGILPGFQNIGESRYLVNSKMQYREIPCGCGAVVENCSVWGPILKELDPKTIEYATHLITLKKFFLISLISKLKMLQNHHWTDLVLTLKKIYKLVPGHSDVHVIVDSSKHPALALLLNQLPGSELYVIHLVRDARGVIASWIKPKGYLKARPPFQLILEWNLYNLLTECLHLFGYRTLFIKYETLVTQTETTIRRILDFTGEQQKSKNTKPVESEILQHILAGNPGKFNRWTWKKISLAEWDLPYHIKAAVNFLCGLNLIRYGYFYGNDRHK
jgi:hypothetical protein